MGNWSRAIITSNGKNSTSMSDGVIARAVQQFRENYLEFTATGVKINYLGKNGKNIDDFVAEQLVRAAKPTSKVVRVKLIEGLRLLS